MQDETHIEKQSLKEEEFRAIRLIDRCIRDLRRLKSGLGN